MAMDAERECDNCCCLKKEEKEKGGESLVWDN